MKRIKCDECGKFLFSTNEMRMGAVGFEAQKKGFVYKIPALFTNKYERLFFCNHECGKSFYDKHIPKDPEVTKALKTVKENIPQMAKDCANGLAKLQTELNKRLKR